MTLPTLAQLAERARRLDGRGYKAYKSLAGGYASEGLQLWIDHVQGDPFAAPSRLRAVLPDAGLPEWARETPARCVAAADFLNRALRARFGQASSRRGSGRGGELSVLEPGQQVLERTSLVVFEDGEVEARFTLGLPARGRRVMGRAAAELLSEDLPRALGCLRGEELDLPALRRQLETVDDAQALRAQLAPRGLVAFVAEGALLPRRSGVDDRPLGEGAVPFAAPPELRVTLRAPHAGEVPGLGIPAGVTLIVGGGFHGKSTLLRALERGVYDHVPGDGRERVVTVADAVKVRAEDGRAVTGVDIGGFIGDLPGGQDTRAFSSANASGSTSQAAAVIEALEAEATCLLIDEDTSATNFMLRDARMQALIAREHEPITPYLDRARGLAERGVSTVLVVGGAGDYFDVADTVIALEAYAPRCATEAARRIAAELPSQRQAEAHPWEPPRPRRLDLSSLDARKGRREASVKVPAPDRCLFGAREVALAAVEQLVEPAQVRAIARALLWAREHAAEREVSALAREVLSAIEDEGVEVVQDWLSGDLARFRRAELVAFLSRLRGLRVEPG